MGSAEKHPHIDSPSEEQLRQLAEDRSEEVRESYLALHRLILDTLPDVECSVDLTDAQIGYGARQYGYDGWGMAALAPHSKWVSLVFMRATSLDDPAGLLEGTGKKLRHVKVRSPEELAERRDGIRALLEQAATVARAGG